MAGHPAVVVQTVLVWSSQVPWPLKYAMASPGRSKLKMSATPATRSGSVKSVGKTRPLVYRTPAVKPAIDSMRLRKLSTLAMLLESAPQEYASTASMLMPVSADQAGRAAEKAMKTAREEHFLWIDCMTMSSSVWRPVIQIERMHRPPCIHNPIRVLNEDSPFP